MYTERMFESRRTSVAHARAFVVEVLHTAGVDDRVEDARLCTSELTTNAIVHGTPSGRELLVRVCVDESLLRVEVHDAGGGSPRLCTATADDNHGRGLFLVGELADDWGVTGRPGPGKVVWAEFKIDPASAAITC